MWREDAGQSWKDNCTYFHRVWVPTGNLVTKSSSKYKMDLLSLDWVHHGALADNFVCVFHSDFILSLPHSLPLSSLFSLSPFFPPLSVHCSLCQDLVKVKLNYLTQSVRMLYGNFPSTVTTQGETTPRPHPDHALSFSGYSQSLVVPLLPHLPSQPQVGTHRAFWGQEEEEEEEGVVARLRLA